MAKYKRIILKLSGETLSHDTREKVTEAFENKKSTCYNQERIEETARIIAKVAATGTQLGIVLGGGNIWRGRFTDAMEATAADQMGMLATVINALCLEEALMRIGVKAITFTAQDMPRFAKLYTARDASEALDNGYVVLLAGGTGNPFFTTDSGAALRAAELHADAVFKGTTVDGLFDSDPKKNKNAKFIPECTYKDAIDQRLAVMDVTAFEICLKQKVNEIRIFNMDDLEKIYRVVMGEDIGSRVHA